MFALTQPPATRLTLAGARYRLVRVFKHDFFAATSLYEATGPAEIPQVVVKIARTQDFCGLPMAWLGRLGRDHERDIYRALAGVPGIPRWVDSLGEAGAAIEYIPASPLDHGTPLCEGFFDALRALLDGVHARGVAYVDANKRSNILVDEHGRPWLIDFQIALRLRNDWPWPMRQIQAHLVAYMQAQDLYHLYKHKRRIAPDELTAEEEAISRRRTGWHWLHRQFSKPYRAFRRRVLRKQYEKGSLVSPTANLEDHYQPEKETWRKKDS